MCCSYHHPVVLYTRLIGNVNVDAAASRAGQLAVREPLTLVMNPRKYAVENAVSWLHIALHSYTFPPVGAHSISFHVVVQVLLALLGILAA